MFYKNGYVSILLRFQDEGIHNTTMTGTGEAEVNLSPLAIHKT